MRTLSTFGQVWLNGVALRVGLTKPHAAMMRPRLVGRMPRISQQDVTKFVQQTGGDVAYYRDDEGNYLVPHTYFATWGLAELARVLQQAHLPLNFSHVVHAASTARIDRLQRVGEQGQFVATVETVIRRAHRVRIELQLVTSTKDGNPLAEYTLAIVLPGPHPRSRSSRKAHSYDRRIPEEAMAIEAIHLGQHAGWDYAKLSGDFNPIHWAGPIARLVGLPGPIAHGFNLMARANHAIVRELGHGRPEALRCLDVAFRRPVTLPADLTVYVGEPMQRRETCSRSPFWLGERQGSEANVVGRVEIHSCSHEG